MPVGNFFKTLNLLASQRDNYTFGGSTKYSRNVLTKGSFNVPVLWDTDLSFFQPEYQHVD